MVNPKKKNETQAINSRQINFTNKRKKTQTNSKPPYRNLKKKLKNIQQIEMNSTPTIKIPGQPKQKAQAPIVQAGIVHKNTKVVSERPGDTFKRSPAKFDAVSSPSRIKLPMGMNKL